MINQTDTVSPVDAKKCFSSTLFTSVLEFSDTKKPVIKRVYEQIQILSSNSRSGYKYPNHVLVRIVAVYLSLQRDGLLPTISLSTLNSHGYRRKPKTGYGMCWGCTFPIALSVTSSQSLRDAPQRNPMLLFVLVEVRALRQATRRVKALQYQRPPRNTRYDPDFGPVGFNFSDLE